MLPKQGAQVQSLVRGDPACPGRAPWQVWRSRGPVISRGGEDSREPGPQATQDHGPPPLTVCLLAGTPELSTAERKELESKLKEREEFLLPIYHQVAVQFADLHDTPGRIRDRLALQGGTGDCSRFILPPCATPYQMQRRGLLNTHAHSVWLGARPLGPCCGQANDRAG